MATKRWRFYQWEPADFWSDYRINGVSGLSLAVLRILHDHIWMQDTKIFACGDPEIAQRLRLTIEEWRTAKAELMKARLIAYDDNGLFTVHTEELWRRCKTISESRKPRQ